MKEKCLEEQKVWTYSNTAKRLAPIGCHKNKGGKKQKRKKCISLVCGNISLTGKTGGPEQNSGDRREKKNSKNSFQC